MNVDSVLMPLATAIYKLGSAIFQLTFTCSKLTIKVPEQRHAFIDAVLYC